MMTRFPCITADPVIVVNLQGGLRIQIHLFGQLQRFLIYFPNFFGLFTAKVLDDQKSGERKHELAGTAPFRSIQSQFCGINSQCC